MLIRRHAKHLNAVRILFHKAADGQAGRIGQRARELFIVVAESVKRPTLYSFVMIHILLTMLKHIRALGSVGVRTRGLVRDGRHGRSRSAAP